MVTIDPPQSPYTVIIGTRLLLYCIVKGFPIPTIQWYKNSVEIPGQTLPFYLVSTSFPHTTMYTCEGKNNAGNMKNIARANITVNVKSMSFYITLLYKYILFIRNCIQCIINMTYILHMTMNCEVNYDDIFTRL